MAQKKAGWIDYDAGGLLDGKNLPSLSKDFFDYVIDVASGNKAAKSESFDKRDLAIFKDGVTL